MPEITVVETTKPAVKTITLKLAAYEARDLLTFIGTYYAKYGSGSAEAKSNATYKAVFDALEGTKPKLDGLNLANGKVVFA